MNREIGECGITEYNFVLFSFSISESVLNMDKVKIKLLQASINHGSMNMDTLGQILSSLCDAYEVNEPENRTVLIGMIGEIDTELHEYEQTLQLIKHPLDDQEYLVFGSLIANQACKFQPQYTDTERKFFYKLLETLASSEDYGVEWMNIYSIANQLPANAQHPLSKQRIQDLENIWVSQGYLLEKDDKIYFGPRTLVEFGNFLKNNFAEYINDCVLCNKIVYWDVKCSECTVKLHRDCIRRYLIKKSTCPSCKKIWNTNLSLSQS